MTSGQLPSKGFASGSQKTHPGPQLTESAMATSTSWRCGNRGILGDRARSHGQRDKSGEVTRLLRCLHRTSGRRQGEKEPDKDGPLDRDVTD